MMPGSAYEEAGEASCCAPCITPRRARRHGKACIGLIAQAVKAAVKRFARLSALMLASSKKVITLCDYQVTGIFDLPGVK